MKSYLKGCARLGKERRAFAYQLIRKTKGNEFSNASMIAEIEEFKKIKERGL